MAAVGQAGGSVKRLLIDIETSPNLVYAFNLRNAFIGPDQIVEPSRMLCWGAKWYGESKTIFRAEWDRAPGFLMDLWFLLDEADAVIHYNGKRFDRKRINGEFYQAGIKPPSPCQQIDLWSAVSRQFDYPSEKLDYILGVSKLPRKLETGGFKLWRDVMQGDPKARRQMRRYNIQDVVAMEPLYEQLLPWIPGHPNMALTATTPGTVCTQCGSTNVQKRGLARTLTGAYQRVHCQDCGAWGRAVKREFGADTRTEAA